MDGASGYLRLMGRDCSRLSPQASFSLCLIKLNYSACPRQTRLFIIIIPIFNLVMVMWEFAMANLSALHSNSTVQHIISLIPSLFPTCYQSKTQREIAVLNLLDR